MAELDKTGTVTLQELLVTKSEAQVDSLLEAKQKADQEGKKTPSVVVIDARIQPPASKR